MTMIESVEIRNFQSHKHTVLEFVPGTNVIIGLSDAGKSAIFRAIEWVVSNRPLGDAYRSEWGGDTHVILRLTDGVVVERLRSASKNEYRLNGEVLKAFGTEPPEEVTKALRMDSANVQAQGTPPFLLSASPGEAARMLNKAASLDEIDKTISSLRRSQQEKNRELEFNTKQKEEFEALLEEYIELPRWESEVESLEELQNEYDEKEGRLKTLSRHVETGRRMVNRLKETDHIPPLLDQYQEVSEGWKTYLQDLEQFHSLKSIIRQARRIEKKLETTERVPELLALCEEASTDRNELTVKEGRVSALRSLVRSIKDAQDMLEATEHLGDALTLLTGAESTLSEYEKQKDRVSGLRRLVSQARRRFSQMEILQDRINQAEAEYHEIAPETCPLCGKEMTI